MYCFPIKCANHTFNTHCKCDVHAGDIVPLCYPVPHLHKTVKIYCPTRILNYYRPRMDGGRVSVSPRGIFNKPRWTERPKQKPILTVNSKITVILGIYIYLSTKMGTSSVLPSITPSFSSLPFLLFFLSQLLVLIKASSPPGPQTFHQKTSIGDHVRNRAAFVALKEQQ